MSDEHPIQDLYDGRLTPEELREAEQLLIRFIEMLIAMDDERKRKEINPD